MCGIFACLGCLGQYSGIRVSHGYWMNCIILAPLCFIQARLLAKLTHRGPDLTGDSTFSIGNGKELHLLGTLLQMRGNVTPQPISRIPQSISKK